MKNIFNKEQTEYIKTNYKSMSYRDMANLELFCGFESSQIKNKALAMGLRKREPIADKKYFQDINTPRKAYWLGFIYADGNIQYNPKNRNYEVSVEIDSIDEHILLDLSNIFKNKYQIKNRKRMKTMNGYDFASTTSFIRIYSKDLCETFIQNGVAPCKTKAKLYPKIKPCGLFFHFLRGFFDGDGCLYKNHRGNLEVSFTNSNEEFLIYLKDMIFKYIGAYGNIYKENELKFKLVFYRKYDALNLLNSIYSDCNTLRLNRKFKIYNDYIGSPA